MKPPSPPRILQIGHGRFGPAHLRTWQLLAKQGLVSLAGVVVRSETSRAALAQAGIAPVYRGLDTVPLAGIDGVDIVTPPATHFDLVRRLLPHAHVLVEKPLADTVKDADALCELAATSGKILTVGHVFRFHPVITELRKLVAVRSDRPQVIFGAFLNPADEAPDNPEPGLVLLHWFDIIDLLFGAMPDSCSTARQGTVDVVSLRYPGPTNAILKLGWEGPTRQRTLDLIYRDCSMQADLIDQTIVVDSGTAMRRIIFPHGHVTLEAELRGFVAAIRRGSTPDVDAATGARIVGIALRAAPRPLLRKPRVAVIGGGIFGATCAAELGGFCEVTLLERHDTLLQEASTLNQWRYHHGFHYPRSVEMIREIQACRHEFEAIYGSAIVDDVPSYYFTVPSARVITRERYLHVCSSMDLQFSIESPPPNVIDAARVNLCMRTKESVFDAGRLRRIVEARLRDNPGVAVALGHAVTGGELLPDGQKKLRVEHDGVTRELVFDYVVNATYTNRNLVAKLFGFPLKPLRFDLLELLVVELKLPRLSATVLDGPFTSLVSTGEDNLFTLSHIQQSVLASATPGDGLPPVWGEPPSNRENLLRHAAQYFPALRGARYVASRYGTRTVHALPEDVDGRPSVVVDHGFGCWSILGGKVNTSVSNARQIAGQIAAQQRIARASGNARSHADTTDDGEEWRDRSPIGARRR